MSFYLLFLQLASRVGLFKYFWDLIELYRLTKETCWIFEGLAEQSVIEQESGSDFEEENEDWDDWGDDDDNEDGESDKTFVCLFSDSQFSSCCELFEHCRLIHKFDFDVIRKELGLDFYGSFKLINYVRSQVSWFWLVGFGFWVWF